MRKRRGRCHQGKSRVEATSLRVRTRSSRLMERVTGSLLGRVTFVVLLATSFMSVGRTLITRVRFRCNYTDRIRVMITEEARDSLAIVMDKMVRIARVSGRTEMVMVGIETRTKVSISSSSSEPRAGECSISRSVWAWTVGPIA